MYTTLTNLHIDDYEGNCIDDHWCRVSLVFSLSPLCCFVSSEHQVLYFDFDLV